MRIRSRSGSPIYLIVLMCNGLASCVSMDTTDVTDAIGIAAGRLRNREIAASRPAEPTTQPAVSASRPAAVPMPLSVTVEEAIATALENNRELAVERLNPQIRRTREQEERAAFDPVLTAGMSYRRERITRPPTTQVNEGVQAALGVKEFLPTGTTLQLDGTAGVQQGAFGEDDQWSSRVALSATQALLRGGGLEVNLVGVRQARIDVRMSQYELRGFVQDLVALVESTYWDCVLARRRIDIVQSSLTLAEQQQQETQERIRIGKLAEVELAAAEAEVALRGEELIDARSALAKTTLKLLRLLNPSNTSFANVELELATLPGVGDPREVDPDLHLVVATRMRPDLNQARLLIERNQLELVRTRNGLLPRLDLFVTLGASGYADSFGGSVRKTGDRNYDILVGISGEYPLLNREARAQHQRATLDRDQAQLALANLIQLAEVDVRSACIELKRTMEQVRATAATRRAQEEKLRSETEKFRVGKSTTLLVAAVQRDLLSAQLSEVEAVVSYLKAMIELRRLDGSLLDHCGVSCPGAEPVNPAAASSNGQIARQPATN